MAYSNEQLSIMVDDLKDDVKDLKEKEKEQDKRLNINDLDMQQTKNDISVIKETVFEIRDYQKEKEKEKDDDLRHYKRTTICWIITIVLVIIACALGLKEYI